MNMSQFSDPEIQAVGFTLGEDEYAISIAKVRKILPMQEIRQIPKAPAFVEGVINDRGKILPAMDLRKRFEIPLTTSRNAKILIVEINKMMVGLIVDNVSEVIKIKLSLIEPPPPVFLANISSRYIQGVAKLDNKMVVLLDVEKLLSYEERDYITSLN